MHIQTQIYGGFPEVKQLCLFQQLRFSPYKYIFTPDQCSLQGNASDIIIFFSQAHQQLCHLERKFSCWLWGNLCLKKSPHPHGKQLCCENTRQPPSNPCSGFLCLLRAQNFPLAIWISFSCLPMLYQSIYSCVSEAETSPIKQPELQGAVRCDSPAERCTAAPWQ